MVVHLKKLPLLLDCRVWQTCPTSTTPSPFKGGVAVVPGTSGSFTVFGKERIHPCICISLYTYLCRMTESHPSYSICAITRPDQTPTTYPANCGGPAFVPPTGDLLNKLSASWLDCDAQQSMTLWQHEWEKHGQCAYQQVQMDQDTFFNTVLSLYQAVQGDIATKCPATGQDCTIGCYDLNLKPIACPSSSRWAGGRPY
jgi:hypothetical protein